MDKQGRCRRSRRWSRRSENAEFILLGSTLLPLPGTTRRPYAEAGGSCLREREPGRCSTVLLTVARGELLSSLPILSATGRAASVKTPPPRSQCGNRYSTVRAAGAAAY